MAGERGRWGITNKGYGFFCNGGGDENVLELVVEGVHLCEYAKSHQIYIHSFKFYFYGR